MAGKANNSGTSGGIASGALLASAVGLLALPSAVLAFSSRFEPRNLPVTADAPAEALKSARFAPNLAAALPVQVLDKQSGFRFTPAGTANRPERSVTVAVRVDPQWEQTILVRGVVRRLTKAEPGAAPLQIAPTAFSLGVSRGYQSFAQKLVPPPERLTVDMPDLASLQSKVASEGRASRFNPKIVLDEKQATGRSLRTFAGDQELVDVGGSYRVTRNLDVTAGIRYTTPERDRLSPLTDQKKDNQAVYVGTQFRF